MKPARYEIQILNEVLSPKELGRESFHDTEWRKWSLFYGTEANAIKQLEILKSIAYLNNRKLRLVRVVQLEVEIKPSQEL